jgi:methionyl-tRNA formyltransferase
VFAQRALAALVEAGHEIALVLTRPDKPAQRGQQLLASPVKQWALEHGLPLWQPATLRDPQTWERLRAAGADAMVVAAYGLILPAEVLAIPPLGCLNIHASLLPRWRGAAPIHRAIEAGDAHTGVTIMQMDAGLDTGAMLLTQIVPIAADDTTARLHDKLAGLGAQLIVQALAQAGTLTPTAQPAEGMTYAAKIDKAEAALDWQAPAALLERRIRAFQPAPGAGVSIAGTAIKIWQASVQPHAQGSPGTVLAAGEQGIDVATAEGVLRLERLQKAGGKPLQASEFLRGFAIAPGQCFDAKAAP